MNYFFSKSRIVFLVVRNVTQNMNFVSSHYRFIFETLLQLADIGSHVCTVIENEYIGQY